MILTVFLAVVFCAAVTMLLVAAVAFVQNDKFFSSAPKEARELIQPRPNELFYGARVLGWVIMLFSVVLILGTGVLSIWDGVRRGYTFMQFFIRFVLIFTIYKLYDMVFFDWFLLCRFQFFQYFYPEITEVYNGRKYGFNIRSQLLKLLVIFPAASALAAWLCVKL